MKRAELDRLRSMSDAELASIETVTVDDDSREETPETKRSSAMRLSHLKRDLTTSFTQNTDRIVEALGNLSSDLKGEFNAKLGRVKKNGEVDEPKVVVTTAEKTEAGSKPTMDLNDLSKELGVSTDKIATAFKKHGIRIPEGAEISNWEKVRKYASDLGVDIQEKTEKVIDKAKGWFQEVWDWVKKKFNAHPTLSYIGGLVVGGAAMFFAPSIIVQMVGAVVVTGVSVGYLAHAKELEDKRTAMLKSVGAEGNEEKTPSHAEIIIKKLVSRTTISFGFFRTIGLFMFLVFDQFLQFVQWWNMPREAEDKAEESVQAVPETAMAAAA